MKVLIACEMSGRVRDAFLRRGHDAELTTPGTLVGPVLVAARIARDALKEEP